jgi:L-amino acid N-acyltransferase YncA
MNVQRDSVIVSPVEQQDFEIRRFQPRDREEVRELCCNTGFLGNPIDPVFEDRELFADYLTAYYTDWEPESSFVIAMGGRVKGYLLGSRRPFRQQMHGLYQNLSLFLRGVARYPRYNAASRKFVHWILLQGWREVPAAPRRTAHFHINLLPEARKVATTRALVDAYLSYLKKCGEKRVFGQMVTFESRRGARMFERYGFRVLNRSEITKYRDVHPEPVYLCTVVKDLEENESVYRNRSKETAAANSP